MYDLDDVGLGQVSGPPALRRLFEEGSGEQPIGHHATDIIVTEDADATARVRSMGLSVGADGRAGTVVYHDVVEPTPARWRIARRRLAVQGRP